MEARLRVQPGVHEVDASSLATLIHTVLSPAMALFDPVGHHHGEELLDLKGKAEQIP